MSEIKIKTCLLVKLAFRMGIELHHERKWYRENKARAICIDCARQDIRELAGDNPNHKRTIYSAIRKGARLGRRQYMTGGVL